MSGSVETPIYDRQRLQPGDCIDGFQPSSRSLVRLTVVFPGLQARVDDFANLILTRCGPMTT